VHASAAAANDDRRVLVAEAIDRGGTRNFGKGGPVRGEVPNRAPKTRAPAGDLGASPENFEKLDAISCNLAYILGDQNGLGYHSKLGLC